jgi:excisionase family DNA binding protein
LVRRAWFEKGVERSGLDFSVMGSSFLDGIDIVRVSVPLSDSSSTDSGSAVGAGRCAGKIAYSIDEAARALGLSKTTLKILLGCEAIHSVRVGRRRIIPRSSLEGFIEKLIEEQR